MYELTIETSFAGAHNLLEYEGSCERLHGHNWRVEVRILAEDLNELGIGVDFRTLKAEVDSAVEGLDHRYLNEIPPFDKLNPSAENIAKYIFDKLSAKLDDHRVRVSSVRVWESEKASAIYYSEEFGARLKV